MSEEAVPYWKPEPHLKDGTYWSLLIPASLYVIGIILYGSEAMMAKSLTREWQSIGSFLMVVGGESGTLATVMEIYRKQKIGETNRWDWLGLTVSLIATLGTPLVVFARQTEIAAWWVSFVATWGPLALLICSGLDFYATGVELGYYRASFNERHEKWLVDKRNHDEKERKRLWNLAHPEETPLPVDDLEDVEEIQGDIQVEQGDISDEQEFPEKEPVVLGLSKDERQVALLALYRDNPRATQANVAERFSVSRTTIGNDLKELAASGTIRNDNGHGVEVL